jgi:hypothetical protein
MNPTACAIVSIGSSLFSIRAFAASVRNLSTALAGVCPVSARNIRPNWRALSPAAFANSPTDIDFALTVAAELADPVAAQSLQLALEYAPAPPFDSGTPDRASAEVLARVRSLNAKAAIERRAAFKQISDVFTHA